jgi:hypothetical protein
MSRRTLEAQKHALHQLAAALLACEAAHVTVRCHDDKGAAASFAVFARPRAGIVERLYDGNDHGGQDVLNYAAVELALDALE